MLIDGLLKSVPTRNESDRAALTVHGSMLEHGFVCVGRDVSGMLGVAVAADGSASLQVVPTDWNNTPDTYSFGYVHPLRGGEETFTVKILSIGATLAVHAASSLASSDLLTIILEVGSQPDNNSPEGWREKMAIGIAMKLLDRNNSTAKFGKSLAQQVDAPPQSSASATGSKRPAPAGEPPNHHDGERPGGWAPPGRFPFPDPGRGGLFPAGGDPFSPFPATGEPPIHWTPDGGLLGPRHPAWGQPVPFGGRGGIGGGGMLPRFDPIGPGHHGLGEPNPDHLRIPGFEPGHFPAFQGGATGKGGGRGGNDPFIL